jgi:hypothetical protein
VAVGDNIELLDHEAELAVPALGRFA